MFLDEARIAARIRHANVVATLEVLEDRGELIERTRSRDERG
jgi:DNA-binding MarR family transcriptional regulator